MVEEGLRVLLLGVTTVFAFLGLLIALMAISGRIFRRWAPPPPAAPATPSPGTPVGGEQDGAAVAVAVAIAWRERRARTARPGRGGEG